MPWPERTYHLSRGECEEGIEYFNKVEYSIRLSGHCAHCTVQMKEIAKINIKSKGKTLLSQLGEIHAHTHAMEQFLSFIQLHRVGGQAFLARRSAKTEANAWCLVPGCLIPVPRQDCPLHSRIV